MTKTYHAPSMLAAIQEERSWSTLPPDTNTTRTMRFRLLHGQVLNSALESPAVLTNTTHVRRQLESWGYRWRAEPVTNDKGKRATLWSIENPNDEPVHTATFHEAPRTSTSRPRRRAPKADSRVSQIVAILRNGPESVESLARLMGCTQDQVTKGISNVRRSPAYNVKLTRLTDGRYLLDEKPARKKTAALSRATHHDAPRAQHSNGHVDAGHNGLPTLPELGQTVKVRALSLNDDGSVSIALKNGAGTWLVQVNGYVTQ